MLFRSLVNSAAFNEFSAAARSLSGSADLQLRGRNPQFDEAIYAQVSNMSGVEVAAPVLEMDVSVPGQRTPIKLLGIDTFVSAAIAPDLIPVPDADKPFDMLMADTVFLSPAAMQWLSVAAGDTLTLVSGARQLKLRVAGSLVRTRAGQRLAIMDIGSAQWQFAQLGRLSRIDIRLMPGVSREAFSQQLQQTLGPAFIATQAQIGRAHV